MHYKNHQCQLMVARVSCAGFPRKLRDTPRPGTPASVSDVMSQVRRAEDIIAFGLNFCVIPAKIGHV